MFTWTDEKRAKKNRRTTLQDNMIAGFLFDLVFPIHLVGVDLVVLDSGSPSQFGEKFNCLFVSY